jgi:hypothetical protein
MKGCVCSRDRVIVPINVFTAAAKEPTIDPLVDALVWLWPFPFAVVIMGLWTVIIAVYCVWIGFGSTNTL